MNSSNVLIIHGAESNNRRGRQLFEIRTTAPVSWAWLIVASQVSKTDYGYLEGMPLAEAILKRMKKFVVFDGLAYILGDMSFDRFSKNREKKY